MTQIETRQQGVTGYVTEGSGVTYDGRNGPEIDLGLAASPIGKHPTLHRLLRERNEAEELGRYTRDVHHKNPALMLIEAVGLQGISGEAVVFNGNGSYGAGDEMVRYFAIRGCEKIYAPYYSFPNVAQWAMRHPGITYTTLEAPELDPMISAGEALNLNQRQLRNNVVYLDYPNNPFGASDPTLLRGVVDHVSQNGGIPFIDLAFGEVLGDEFRDAIQYTIDRGGVCLSSISKTQGCPGIRAGCAILSPVFTNNGYSGDQRMVFGLNKEAEFVYQRLFDQKEDGHYLAADHAKKVAAHDINTNITLTRELHTLGLQVGRTDLRSPIQVVISEQPDFYQRLAQQGIITESLDDYTVTLGGKRGYGDAAVRLLTPRPGELDEVLNRVELAVRTPVGSY